MSTYIGQDKISAHIKKMQGKLSDTAFAKSVNLTRQTMRTIREGMAIPNVHTREKLGLQLCYRLVDPINIEVTDVKTDVAAPAKKTATKKK